MHKEDPLVLKALLQKLAAEAGRLALAGTGSGSGGGAGRMSATRRAEAAKAEEAAAAARCAEEQCEEDNRKVRVLRAELSSGGQTGILIHIDINM